MLGSRQQKVISASALTLALGLGAAAQTQDETAESNARRQLDTVVVTARKTEESAQSVPITLTAFGGGELETKGITDFQTLTNATPGLTIDTFPKSAPRPFIRGIGTSNTSAGADPSSVAFLDGVYLGRSSMLNVDIFDVQRVEVLKGPQGTLWGKNVVGGAVHFITNRPTDEFEGRARLTFAEFNQVDFDAMLNVPLSENFAARGVFSVRENDGYRTDLDDGRALDDIGRFAGRLHLWAGLGADTDLLFTIDGTSDEDNGTSRFNLLPFGGEDLDDPRTANPDVDGFVDRETWGVKGEINSSLLGWADLTGIVSYREVTLDNLEDFDGTDPAGNAAAGVPVSGVTIVQLEEAESFSTEWRLASTGGGPLQWVGGLFYLNDDVERGREIETAVPDPSENLFLGLANIESAAIFGEVQYDITDRASIIGGLRFTHEEKDFEITNFVGDPAAPTIGFTTVGNPGETNEDRLSWRAGADFQLTNDIFLFGTVSTGFKSGAFQLDPDEETARIATAPETVINYEIGIKSEWADGRVRANLSAFLADYEDLQTIQAVDDASKGPGGITVVTDTGEATIQGIETEVTFAPTPNFRIDTRYTFLDATFDEFIETDEILASGERVLQDLSGNQLSRTPKHAASVSALYSSNDYDWGSFDLGIDANYQSKVFDDNDNGPLEVREARVLLNSHISFRPNDRFTIQVWGRNLTNELIRVHQAAVAGGLFVQYGPPRQFGVTISTQF